MFLSLKGKVTTFKCGRIHARCTVNNNGDLDHYSKPEGWWVRGRSNNPINIVLEHATEILFSFSSLAPWLIFVFIFYLASLHQQFY